MKPLPILALAAILAGCTSAEITRTPDGYTANLTRFWSDVALEVATPDGGSLRYTSAPETAMSDQMLSAFLGGRLRASEP